MNSKNVVFASADIALLSISQAHGAVILQTATFGGSTYHLIGGDAGGAGINFTDSEAFAVSLGGHLVTVGSAAENTFLFDTFATAQFGTWAPVNSLYLGINDAASEGNFQWTSGEPVTFTSWAAGEPNNTHNREDWGTMVGAGIGSFGDGNWNDVPNIANTSEVASSNFPFYGIAEIPGAEIPEPTTLIIWSLLATLGLSFGWRRRRRAF